MLTMGISGLQWAKNMVICPKNKKKQISKANKGRKHTPEAIDKMREAAIIRNKQKRNNELP